MRSLIIVISLIILLFANCGEAHRLRSISIRNGSRDVSRAVESILWNAEQAAIRGERFMTCPVNPDDNVSEIIRQIKKIDRKFRIEKSGTNLKVSW